VLETLQTALFNIGFVMTEGPVARKTIVYKRACTGSRVDRCSISKPPISQIFCTSILFLGRRKQVVLQVQAVCSVFFNVIS
jgi:hypothetical protein